MIFQYYQNGKPAAPKRKNIIDARWDAVNAGVAKWTLPNSHMIFEDMGGSIRLFSGDYNGNERITSLSS